MAGVEESERGLDSILNSFTRTLECPLCLDDEKELKILICCDKLICSPCLDGLFDKEKNRQLQDGAPLCPMCQQEMTLKPEQYPVNKLAQHLQTYTQTLKRAVEKGSTDKCQSVNCKRDVDMYCTSCKMFTCYRCKDKQCEAGGGAHDAVDVTSCVDERREDFNLWRSAKEREIQAMKDKRAQICSEVKRRCQELVTLPADRLENEIEKTTLLLTTSRQEIQGLNEKISKESSSLQLMVDSTERVGETEFIHLISQLNIYKDNWKVKLGAHELLMEDVVCYDVSAGYEGRILVARENGLDVFDVGSGKVEKSLLYDGNCIVVEVHGDQVITAVSEHIRPRTRLITLNSSYEEVNSWSTMFSGCDFTKLDDKVFITRGQSIISSGIEVFSSDGKQLSSILWNGTIVGITSVAPHSIVFGDMDQHRVYKQRVTGNRKMEWKTDVKVPRCLCVDDNGLIWVRSNANDSLTILRGNGKRHQDDIMDIMSENKIGEVNDMCVYGDYLYVAHEGGLGRFQIAYE